MTFAYAAPQARAVDDPENLVDTVSPSGTTINVFDYWRGGYENRWENDTSNPENRYNQWVDAGINNGHVLKFASDFDGSIPRGAELVGANKGGSDPKFGVVNPILGADGYPSLSGDAAMVGSGSNSTESLSYLFDLNNIDNAKQAYSNVQGLLKVDENGYYVYDAKQNFAEFVEEGDTGHFNVYNHWAVSNGDDAARRGQFFLFNDADDVLEDRGSGLADRGVEASSSMLHHYFGLSMSTQFAQQYGGFTSEDRTTRVTYNFSGDDDVWVYIDGYLVGDLGGIHSAVALDIDFSTGQVIIFTDSNRDNDYTSGEHVFRQTTIRAMMQEAVNAQPAESQAALQAEIDSMFVSNDSSDDGYSIFKDGTSHTLDFFYMERGNTDSNMSLKFNLQSIPRTDIVKVDQDGGPVSGATFRVTDTDTGALICTATTERDGSVVLMQPDSHTLITPDWLANNGHGRITLTEETVPSGYRATKPIQLSVKKLEATDGSTLNVLLSDNQWESGAYAQPKVTATTPHDISLNGHDAITVEDLRKDGAGTLFAVVQHKGADGQWHTVTGDALSGWRLTTGTDLSGALEADAAAKYEFEIGMSGNFQAEIENLPGDINEYVFFKGDAGTFRGAYYYTEAESLDLANTNNTYEVVNTGNFDRQFSARVYVSDIINRVVVQKTDATTGEAINGATLALFNQDQVTANDDGTYTLNEDATPIGGSSSPRWQGETKTLSKETDKISLEGAVVFAGLEPGVYYVGEVSAPEGYAKTNEAAKIIVTADGVYADAGTATDGIAVTRGVGRLMDSMSQFAADNGIDATLENIVATPKLGAVDESSTTPTVSFDSEPAGDPIHLTYSPDGEDVLDYEITSGTDATKLGFRTESGIPGMTITQCNDDSHATTATHRENLETIDLTGLFTGTTIVHLDNESTGNLVISKSVQGESADANDEFTFTVNLTDANGGTLTGDYPAQKYTGNTPEGQPTTLKSGGKVTLKSGQSIVIQVGESANYTVTEAAADGYITVAMVDGQKAEDVSGEAGFTAEGSIPADGSSTVVFTNTAFNEDEAKDVFATDEDQGNAKIDGSIDDQAVQVGDVLTYEVKWVNYKATNAEVTVTDTVPENTEFVSADAVNGNSVKPDDNGILTWNLGEQEPGATGTVSFKVRVLDSAATTTVENQATISVGENDPDITTNTTHNPVPGKSVTNNGGAEGNDGSTAQVGDLLTYTISFKNVKQGETVVVTDTLDKGLTFVENTTDEKLNATFAQDEQNPQNLTWTIKNAPAGLIAITYTAQVNEHALPGANDPSDPGTVVNTAQVQVGNDPKVTTNETDTEIEKSYLTIQKTVRNAEGTEITPEDEFEFTVTLKDKNGQPLTGTYTLTIADINGGNANSSELSLAADDASGKAAGTATFTLKGGQQATIAGLPRGTNYTVDEADYSDEGYVIADGSTSGGGQLNNEGAIAKVTNQQTSTTVKLGGTDATVPLTKVLNGRDWKEGDTFTFTLTGAAANGSPSDGYQLPGTTERIVTYYDAVAALDQAEDSDGKQVPFGFDPITFTKPGTYTFTVTEGATSNGVTAATGSVSFTFEVEINPDSNKLEATLTSTPDCGDFVNTYKPGGDTSLDTTAEFGLTKEYTGPWAEGTAFTFMLSGEDASGAPAPMPKDAEGNDVTEVTLHESDFQNGMASFGFGKITYTEPGTYVYTVAERNGGTTTGGISYDGNVATFVVSVVDNLDGGYTANVTSASGAKFENTYDAANGTASLVASKTVNGASKGIEAGAFTFEVKSVAAPDGVTPSMPSNTVAGDNGIYTVSNDADGVVNFGQIVFEQAGTYQYQVSERNIGAAGYTYDSTIYMVEYVVADNNAGQLEVTTNVYQGEDASGTKVKEIAFNNVYKPAPAPATASFGGTKTVNEVDDSSNSYSLEAGDFTFTMVNTATDPAGLTAPVPSAGSEVTNDAEGAFSFGTLTFEQPGTYTYEVRETQGSLPGMSYDGTVYTLAFTVEDQGGALKVTSQSITSSAGGTVDAGELNFTNTYNDGEVSYQIAGTKSLVTNGYTGATLADGDFEFVMVDADGNVIQRVENTGSANNQGSFVFEPIPFKETGTFTYKVMEIGTDGQPGTGGVSNDRITYSAEVYTVTVSVTKDDQTDVLSADAAIELADHEVESIVFTNVYQPGEVTVGPSGNARIEGTKTLTGRALAENEFEFGLFGADGAQVATAKNGADGSFVFRDITYSEQGTYTYTVRELNNGLGGVAYDDAIYTVRVDVTEDPDAKELVATVSYLLNGASAEAMTFDNSYTAKPLEITLGGTKVLGGRELEADEFSFVLRNEDCKEIQTVSNGASGGFAFDPIVYSAPGTYRYTISEVLPQDDDAQIDGVQSDNVTYDETAYEVEVTVTDNGQGNLVLSGLTYDGVAEPLVITNTYEPPSEPPVVPPTNPPADGGGILQTGDMVPTIVGAVLVAGVVLVAAGVILHRKRGA